MTKTRIVLIICTIWTIGFTYWFSQVYAPGRWPTLSTSNDLATIFMGLFLGYMTSLFLPIFLILWNTTGKIR